MAPHRTDDELLAALRTVAARYDGRLTVTAYTHLRDPGQPSVAAITSRFGPWPEALEAAGLPSGGRRYRRWKPDEALDAVARWLATSDDWRQSAYAAAAATDHSLPLPNALLLAVGKWREVVAAAEARLPTG